MRSTARPTFLFLLAFLSGCAGWSRGCSSEWAGMAGADWIVTTNGADGRVVMCWKLSDTSVANEHATNGIYWKDSNNGHLVHLDGWYNRVQVERGDFASAAKEVGVDLDRCVGGKYLDDKAAQVKPAKPGAAAGTVVGQTVELPLNGHLITATIVGDRVTKLKLDGADTALDSPAGRAAIAAITGEQ